ncbi:MAG: aminoglycoside phosphotransferase family protein [Pseudomonadota bacterium]
MTEFKDCYRLASVVLIDRDGEVVGQLAPVKLSTPWFQEMSELIALVKQRDNLDITILRLLTVDDSHLPELLVSYLAELASTSFDNKQLLPWRGQLDEHPLRLSYANPQGPAHDLQWAGEVLQDSGYGPVIEQQQIRTWNLSSIWRLSTASDTFWLKAVPPFFAHESQVLQLFADEKVPTLLATEQHRMLLQHLPGEDCYDATFEQMLLMIGQLVDIQWRWHDRLEELFKTGMPDSRPKVLLNQISAVASQYLHELAPQEQTTLKAFLENLPERLVQLESCGIPDTLVHGDYHPGNWRGVDLDLAILDWGDCSVGHPLLDLPALIERAGEHEAVLMASWCEAWQAKIPDADVKRAAELVKPIATARAATVYQRFLDNIEPSERIYHDADPVFFLKKTAGLLFTV